MRRPPSAEKRVGAMRRTFMQKARRGFRPGFVCNFFRLGFFASFFVI
jgi:hypothetical protein